MKRAIIWCAVSTGKQAEEDKFSLPKQEEDSRKLCEQNGWEIVEVLRVPGHSRNYIDFHELAEAARKQNIDAFDRLYQHWNQRDFDVLILRDGERLARTQALMAYFVEKTIETGAQLYSMADGWVHEDNFRMWISMAGYKASGDIDRLKRLQKRGMTERAKKGLPVSPQIPISHKLIRDKKGKAVRLVVDEDKRRLWNDLAELILEGVAWKKIENELFTRFGHVDDTGRPYNMYAMYTLITNPIFWGHTAQGFRNRKSNITRHSGMWIYDESEPVPDDIRVYRNTVPAVYAGDIASRLKAEIRRRQLSVLGRSTASKTHRFTGLFVCGECGSGVGTYSKYVQRGKPISQLGLRCNMMYQKPRNELFCHQRGYVPYKVIQAYLDARLRDLLSGVSSNIFVGVNDSSEHNEQRIETFRKELIDLETRINILIHEQSRADEIAQGFYRQQVSELATRIESLRKQLAELERKVALDVRETSIYSATIEEIRELSLEVFWQQPDRVINQILHRLFGDRQLVILDKQIIGVTERHKKVRRRP